MKERLKLSKLEAVFKLQKGRTMKDCIRKRKGVAPIIGTLFFIAVFFALFGALYYAFYTQTEAGREKIEETMDMVIGFDDYFPHNASTLLRGKTLLQRGRLSDTFIAGDMRYVVLNSTRVPPPPADCFNASIVLWFRLNLTWTEVKEIVVEVGSHYNRTVTQQIFLYDNFGTRRRGPFATANGSSIAALVRYSMSAAPDIPEADRFIYTDAATGASFLKMSINATTLRTPAGMELKPIQGFIDYVHVKLYPVRGTGYVSIYLFNKGPETIRIHHIWVINYTIRATRALANGTTIPGRRSEVNYFPRGPFAREVPLLPTLPFPSGWVEGPLPHYLFPGLNVTYRIRFGWNVTDTCTVRVVSERGNVWSYTTVPG